MKGWSGVARFFFCGDIGIDRQRVRPGDVAKDSNGEIVAENPFVVGIVMTHGGDATEQISNATPPEPC